MKLALVTATIDLLRAKSCVDSWRKQALSPHTLYVVEQGAEHAQTWTRLNDDDVPLADLSCCRTMRLQHPQILGVVPAFALGVAQALEEGADVVACFHDDLEIQGASWDREVEALFTLNDRVGLAGFSGAEGLGAGDIYQTPYNPMQLARQGFMSNMRDAASHGRRELHMQRVACMDGFSQIGRREYWQGIPGELQVPGVTIVAAQPRWNLFDLLRDNGMVHHAYDAALGCLAARNAWETWYLPVACHHYGGRTAVADSRYTDWAREQLSVVDWKGQRVSGDAAYWTEAHRVCYEMFRDVLPLRVGG